MNKFLKEVLIIIIIVCPYIYLGTIWNELPAKVPIHFNFKGVADDWADKSIFLYLPGLVGFGTYLVMLFIPFFDPKKKIQQMESKYYTLRLMFSIFITSIITFIIYAGKDESLTSPHLLFAIIGAFLAMLGNYFQTLRPNYFIGIRTPWTLENEEVWKKTHRLGGKVWMICGLLIALLSLIMKNDDALGYLFASLICIMILVPILYSYIEFRNQKKSLAK